MARTAISAVGAAPQRILICYDERHIVRLLQVNLEQQGHKVVCAFDANEAVALLESAELLDLPPFDKVVLDAMMSKLDGFQVLRWIRTHAWARNSWVAMMIPRDEDREQREGQPYHADLYVTKPFNPIDLFR